MLNEDVTHVHSTMRMRPNYPAGTAVPPPLLLDGRKDLTLVSLKVNGAALPEGSVQVREEGLSVTIHIVVLLCECLHPGQRAEGMLV